jgi:hypothetical protein
MTDTRSVCLLTLLAWLILSAAAPQAALAANGAFLQGVVGAGSFDADSLTFQLLPAESGKKEDLSTMPIIGFIGQHLFSGDRTQLGVEGGILFGWRSRSTSALITSNQTVVKIDSSLWLLDLSAGVCLNQRLGSRWRLYLAAGPAMVFGEYDADEDVMAMEGAVDPAATPGVRTGSESEFGVGGYARAGLEYEFAPLSLVGFSVRGLATNMEFNNTVDSSRVRGVQAFVTFTRNFGRW